MTGKAPGSAPGLLRGGEMVGQSAGDYGAGAAPYVAGSAGSGRAADDAARRVYARFLGIRRAPGKFHKPMIPLTNYR